MGETPECYEFACPRAGAAFSAHHKTNKQQTTPILSSDLDSTGNFTRDIVSLKFLYKILRLVQVKIEKSKKKSIFDAKFYMNYLAI